MGPKSKLLLSSALMLFLELALIRWTASNIIHLGYFSNFVLLGSFLGVGLGFLRANRTARAPLYFPVVLGLLVAFVFRFPVTVDRTGDSLIFFTANDTTGPPPWVTLPLVFVGVAAIMAGPGELVARCFGQLPRLDAYRLDLLGSLLGIASFTALSFLRAPSFVWGLIVSVLIFVLLWQPAKKLPLRLLTIVLPTAALVTMLIFEALAPGISWSPYYKIKTNETADGSSYRVTVWVNGVPHQSARDAAAKVKDEPQYGVPYDRIGGRAPGHVLVVGAGTGTDVALALSRGATTVDAVEIDPRLQQIGAQRHPDKPYDDPRVTVHINDGRAFLERTDQKFDLIIFALPDSLTLVAGASQLRLESYLFTVEAMRSVRDHLAPGGLFAMYNYYRQDWLVGRLANTVQEAFGHTPCVDLFGAVQAVISSGLTPADQTCGPKNIQLAGPAPATDDHPFLYLENPSLPSIYVFTLLGILLISLISVRVVGGPLKRMRPYGDLFLLGAAFLLLETRSVTGFALLFGTTWVVNALVFAGVLLIVLLAVEATRRFRTPPLPLVYALLAGSLALAAFLPPTLLLSLSVYPRIVAAVLVAFSPIFLANLVFAKRFAETEDATSAFGANLLGAMLGGTLEYLTLLIGYQALLLVAALLYAGSFALLPRGARARISVEA